MIRVLITGSKGFLGKNFVSHLSELKDIEVVSFSRENTLEDLSVMISKIDFVCHFAGVNRPNNNKYFKEVNQDLTEYLCRVMTLSKRKIPLIFASSVQASKDNDYGRSKLYAEKIIKNYAKNTGNDIYIYRFPNLFGKWSKPNYNSVVSTFCHNIANNLPIEIHNYDEIIVLMYVDDVIYELISLILQRKPKSDLNKIPTYSISIGQLAEKINNFHHNRSSLAVDRVGSGFIRALYATYLSYLRPQAFSYNLDSFSDERGVFAEVLKTKDSGQFSFFSSKLNKTRGEHYHHSKNEKFLVVLGEAVFKFRNIQTNEEYSITVNSDRLKIVETIPGWAHNIKNIGDSELLVLLWANEVFNHEKPDTYTYLINNEKN